MKKIIKAAFRISFQQKNLQICKDIITFSKQNYLYVSINEDDLKLLIKNRQIKFILLMVNRHVFLLKTKNVSLLKKRTFRKMVTDTDGAYDPTKLEKYMQVSDVIEMIFKKPELIEGYATRPDEQKLECVMDHALVFLSGLQQVADFDNIVNLMIIEKCDQLLIKEIYNQGTYQLIKNQSSVISA